jgi:hypothetical protein
MSVWSFWTWISVGVLTVGSVLVFLWFLRDLIRLRSDIIHEEHAEEEEGE